MFICMGGKALSCHENAIELTRTKREKIQDSGAEKGQGREQLCNEFDYTSGFLDFSPEENGRVVSEGGTRSELGKGRTLLLLIRIVP